MKRLWSVDELGERWTLSPDDVAFVAGNADAGKLGLACQLVDSLQRLMPALDGGDDFLWISAPDEGCRSLVVLLDEVVDGGLQGDDGMEDAALELSSAQLGEEALDGVQP